MTSHGTLTLSLSQRKVIVAQLKTQIKTEIQQCVEDNKTIGKLENDTIKLLEKKIKKMSNDKERKDAAEKKKRDKLTADAEKERQKNDNATKKQKAKRKDELLKQLNQAIEGSNGTDGVTNDPGATTTVDETDCDFQLDFLQTKMEVNLSDSESDDGIDQGRLNTVPVKPGCYYSSWLVSISAECFRDGGDLRKYMDHDEATRTVIIDKFKLHKLLKQLLKGFNRNLPGNQQWQDDLMYIAVYSELPLRVDELNQVENLVDCWHAHCVIEYHGNQQRGLLSSFAWQEWFTNNDLKCTVTVSEGDGV